MAVTELFVLSGVNIEPASLVLNGIVDSRFEDGVEDLALAPDGLVDPTFLATFQQNPRITVESANIAAALGAIGISGLKMTGAVGTKFYFSQVEAGGTRKTGSEHLSLQMIAGMLIPLTLTARQGAEARFAFAAAPQYDGTNDPIIIAVSQALPSIAAFTTAFTVGPVSINGSALAGVQETRVDFGLDLFTSYGDGDIWPTLVAIRRRAPSITIRCTKMSAINTFGLVGAAQGETDSIIYFRKKADGGANVANATAEHVSLTIADGKINCRTLGGGVDEEAAAETVITPKWDGTNAIIAVSTATAIA